MINSNKRSPLTCSGIIQIQVELIFMSPLLLFKGPN